MSLDERRFKKNDNGFVCAHCGFTVKPLETSSRDHCPKCLYSLHVDINPGDRANDCCGLLRPVSATTDSKKGYVINYICEKCGETHRNRAAYPAKVQPDDIGLIIKLSAGQYDL